LVERGPEKAGVGGSIPSLATNILNNLAIAKKRAEGFSCGQNAYIGSLNFTFADAQYLFKSCCRLSGDRQATIQMCSNPRLGLRAPAASLIICKPSLTIMTTQTCGDKTFLHA
jgi:hypothetical protein